MRQATPCRGTAIYVPGFVDGLDSPAVSAMIDALAEIGLTAVSFEPRGGRPGLDDPVDLALSVQLADVAELVNSYPGDRIVLLGHCYGALISCLAAAADPRVTDVVALMPSRCFIWPDDYDERKDSWRTTNIRPFTRGADVVSVPYRVVTDALGYNLPGALRGIEQRILFVAGEYDQLIGVDAVARLYAECRSPERTFTTLPVQHDFRDEPAQIAQVVRTVTAWIRAR